MSYVKYEGLGTPDGVLQKIRDYVHDEGYTIVEDMMDDLDIFDRNYNDGKRLVFKDKTGNYFINMRSMNGYQIFPEMAGGTVNPAANTLPTTASQKFVGIGATISEGYSKTQRWYDQYLAPKKFNSDYVVGTGVRVAGESPSLKVLEPYSLPANVYGKNYGDITVGSVEYKNVTFPYNAGIGNEQLVIPQKLDGSPVSYVAEKDTFSFTGEFYFDFSFYNNSFLEQIRDDVKQMIVDGTAVVGRNLNLFYPVSLKDSSGNILGTIANGIRATVTQITSSGNFIVFTRLGEYLPTWIPSDAYIMPSKTKLSDFLSNDANRLSYSGIIDVPVSSLTSYGTLPADTGKFRFIRTHSTSYYYYTSPSTPETLGTILNQLVYTNSVTTISGTGASAFLPSLVGNNIYRFSIIYSNQTQAQSYLNPTTLYCNHITTPTDTLVFTLVDKDSKCYQHLIIGNINKYATWDGGIFMSGSHNSYSLSKHVYDNSTFNDILPVLSTTELGATTFARINIDEAPQRSNIYWASSGKPDVSDPYQCYTGKQLAMPIRHGEGITGTWRPMIPHYGYMQSRSSTDPGINSNTLNCITINLPLYMAVKVDPDSLNNFAPIGEVSGVYLVSLFNMASASLYEISYPTSGNLHQVFSLSKRRDKWGFDGISIKQEDNTPTP